ncbi:MAG: hypothetical protein A3E02_00830 [Candidatus Zambryskibacteria bacterium RIFCSPHIGHO2_12_FULL_38_34]|uniref:Glycosyl transferase family 1 domain-containing protein n=1 Tax=Candidatus Zambryskibacteria bacterium RIFCSPLOWO2_12_FULL_39_16 TaxID=1802775 RepID=A0A1G2UQU0_9BACT|nr:MAG: hypothetical protein A3D37_01395 [Candidatus Zambryskibacteria bacterium RIFCSPHIGHO2_02_FULL_38_22]OHA97341.1 MAG: hypothetical protein A3E02_00830 [Candidatus Zambryskibacteria bacterium RIFCSPHIGHO2_12_FULL_38_34]OHB08215.1 MAG: hypothetical protein A3I19_01815 [Candidatus Zambryskibacteria bacterium RIFCSPLOWO2_02_FULL_38_13]OHB11757.1 MAG: hypothetical protein A3G46_01435 [Candidatus Zambryskibacteria bacterium RIFCSPLOWO2_12_FULL_39_16]
MNLLSITTDRRLFEEDSNVRRRVLGYSKYFDRMDIIVFTRKNLKLGSDNLKLAENIFIYPTNSSLKLFYIYDAFRIIKKVIHNSNLVASNSIITAQDPFETGLVGVLIKFFYRFPLHVQVHTDLMHRYFRQSSLLNRLRFFMAKFILRYADRVRAVSERIKKSIGRFSKNIDVLPIKTEIFDNLGEGAQKPFPFTLLAVCRLEKEKNIGAVFKVIKNLKEKNIGLCLVGDGSQKSNLEKMAKNMGISDKVIFTGWKNNLAPYYKMADVFISASLYEGYGISTVEAAYSGKPLILSETGTAREIFRENESAFICDAKDLTCFTQGILKIYRDKNLAENMGQSAKIIAHRHLSSKDNYFRDYADSIIRTANNLELPKK